jgi:glycosyltransferase involved in cell wall biosynthesis
MKVGIFFSLASYGGVQSCIISLTRGLNSIGIIPDLISDRPIKESIVTEQHIRLQHVPVKFSISRGLAQWLSRYLSGAIDILYHFKTSWLQDKYDFIYIFQPNIIIDNNMDYIYYLSMSPRASGYSKKKLRSRIKFILYDHFICHFLSVYDFSERASKSVINSKYTESFFFSSYGKHLKVVYPPILIPDPAGINDEIKNTTLFFSRITPSKRPDIFLSLAAKFPEQQFIMIGGCDDYGYLSYLKEIIHQKNILNTQIYTNLPHDQVFNHMKEAKFYVFTAINEHFGMTTAEAMAHGAIPFVHNSGGQREIVPWEFLRFDDPDMILKFSDLLKMNQFQLQDIRRDVSQHVQQFSEKVFISNMLSYLPGCDPCHVNI